MIQTPQPGIGPSVSLLSHAEATVLFVGMLLSPPSIEAPLSDLLCRNRQRLTHLSADRRALGEHGRKEKEEPGAGRGFSGGLDKPLIEAKM